MIPPMLAPPQCTLYLEAVVSTTNSNAPRLLRRDRNNSEQSKFVIARDTSAYYLKQSEQITFVLDDRNA